MRLLHFSPWQSIESNVPVSSSDSDIPLMMVSQPRNMAQQKKGHILSSSSSKRSETHRLKTFPKVEKSDLIPAMILTTRFHLSVLGRRKDLSEDAPLIEIPEWIYSSKPTPCTAFLSSSTCQGEYLVSSVAAIVDAQRRLVYATQSHNHILSSWSLDKDVGGPDTDDKYVQKYKFDSPIISLHLLPERRRLRIRSNTNNNNKTSTAFVDVTGGVTGLLASGDMFVAFHTFTSGDVSGSVAKLVVGVFQESDIGKSQRISIKGSRKLLLSIVGYTTTTTSSITEQEGVNAREKGRKRKSSEIEGDDIDLSDKSDLGEIVIFALSKETSTDALVLSRHTVEMSSLIWTQQNEDIHIQRSSKASSSNHQTPYLNVSGNYFIRSNLLYLPQNNVQHIFATQLDATHVSLVYNYTTSPSTKGGQWLCSWLDIRRESLSPNPFYVSDPSKDTGHVINVAGISSALISVFSDDGIVKICDVRRAVIVNIITLQSLPGYDPNRHSNVSDVSSDWLTGSLCIIMRPKLEVQSNSRSIVCTSRIRLQDNDLSSSEGSNRALKGSYNLASILASSIMSSKALDISKFIDSPPPTSIRDITSIHPTLNSTTRTASIENDVNVDLKQYLQLLESFRQGKKNPGSTSGTFSKVYRKITNRFPNPGYKEEESKQLIPYKNGQNGIHHTNGDNSISLKDSLQINRIDLSNNAASVAIDIILSSDADDTYLVETLLTLLDIIETGNVSARIAFASNKFNDRTLYHLLLKLHRTIPSKNLVVKFISQLLHRCPDSLPEYMLVILVDFILCHLTTSQLVDSFEEMKPMNHGAEVHTLFHRLTQERAVEANVKTHQNRFTSLQDRLALNLKISLIEATVSYSQCNSTLLRAALRRDLQNVAKGEVEVLFHVLTTLLRKGIDGHMDLQRRKTRTMSILNWLDALVDSHLGIFTASSSIGTESSVCSLADAVRKDIALMIGQGEVLATLDDVLIHFDPTVARNRLKSSMNSILLSASHVSTPDYSIEPLIF